MSASQKEPRLLQAKRQTLQRSPKGTPQFHGVLRTLSPSSNPSATLTHNYQMFLPQKCSPGMLTKQFAQNTKDMNLGTQSSPSHECHLGLGKASSKQKRRCHQVRNIRPELAAQSKTSFPPRLELNPPASSRLGRTRRCWVSLSIFTSHECAFWTWCLSDSGETSSPKL